MNNKPENKSQEPKGKKSRTKITSSGRTSKTPKHLLTTSEDEVPMKKTKTFTSIEKEKQRLRNILNIMNLNKQDVIQNTNINDNASAKIISSKSKLRHIPLENTEPPSIIETSINHNTSASKDICSKRMTESSSTKITQYHLQQSASNSCLLDHTKEIDQSSVLREKKTDKKVIKSSGQNDVDINNSLVERIDTTDPSAELFLPHNTEAASSNFMECGEPVIVELDNSMLRHEFGNILGIFNELNTQRGDMIKQYEEIKQQNEDIKQQNEDIKQQNEDIKQQNNEIKQLISEEQLHRNVGEANLSDKLFETLEGFPLKTIEQFNTANSETNHKLRKNLYNYLKIRGGTKLREFLSLGMKITMTDNLVSQFTWLGDKKHAKIGNTRVSNVLYVAAKNCPYFTGPRDKTEFKTEMKEVLRTTKQRFRNTTKKNDHCRAEDENIEENNNFTVEELEKRLKRLEDLEHSEAEENMYDLINDESDFGDDELD